MPINTTPAANENAAEDNFEAENQDEEEHLPDTTPDCDDEEVEQENNQENIPPGVEQWNESNSRDGANP